MGLITGEAVKAPPPEYPDYLFLLTPEPAAYFAFTDEIVIKLEYDEILSNGSRVYVSKNSGDVTFPTSVGNVIYRINVFPLPSGGR